MNEQASVRTGKKRKLCSTTKPPSLGELSGFSLSSITFEKKEEPKPVQSSEPTFTAAQVEAMFRIFTNVMKEKEQPERPVEPPPKEDCSYIS